MFDADVLAALERIEAGQRQILAALSTGFSAIGGELSGLAAAVRDGRADADFYDVQFTEALGRVSGKINAVAAQLDRLSRSGRPPAPQNVDDLARAAVEVWHQRQAPPD